MINFLSNAMAVLAAEAEARDPRPPEQREAERAIARAASEACSREAALRSAAEHMALLAAAPRYVLPDGTAWRAAGMLGRLLSGNEGDRGRRLHAIPENDRGTWGGTDPALCGARPGPRSVGWGDIEAKPADCPRCVAKLRKAGLRPS